MQEEKEEVQPLDILFNKIFMDEICIYWIYSKLHYKY
jgi:hypothetical protein